MSRKTKRQARLNARREYLAKRDKEGHLRFKQAGLDQLRTNSDLRVAIKNMVSRHGNDLEQGVQKAIMLVMLTSCADEQGQVTATDDELVRFLNENSETLIDMLVEIIGPQRALEIEKSIR